MKLQFYNRWDISSIEKKKVSKMQCVVCFSAILMTTTFKTRALNRGLMKEW
jgi:hypothetical protein